MKRNFHTAKPAHLFGWMPGMLGWFGKVENSTDSQGALVVEYFQG
jgi:hypothetical protein